MPRYLYFVRTFYVLVFISFFAVSCGDTTGQLGTTNEDVFREGGELAPKPSDMYFMVADGETEHAISVTESAALRVKLYSKVTGEPVANQSVAFEIVDEDPDVATLSARNSSTNNEGVATVDLRAGAAEDIVTIHARHASSNGVEFQVSISKRGTGGLNIKLTNSAPSIMELTDLDVRVYRGDAFSCGEFWPLMTQPEPLMTLTASTTADEVVAHELAGGARFVVTAVGRGPRGQIAAGGCVERVTVEANQLVTAEVILQFIPLNPTGIYDVSSFWDFTQVLEDSGPVGQGIMRVLNVFQNPGQALYNEAINLLTYLVNGLVGTIVDVALQLTGLAQTIQNAINDFIDNTDSLRRIRDAGRDLRDVVANLNIHSQLAIGKLGSSYEFRGRDNWFGVTVYWRWNCDENSPPDCGAINMVPDSNGEFAQLGILSSEWDGRVVSYDNLQVDTHALTLRYGRLIQYILNQVILPALTNGNATSLSQAMSYWINCPNFGNSIIPNGQSCLTIFGTDLVCITSQQITNICETAVSSIFGFADLLIRNLEFDMGLYLGGEGKLLELTSDGVVDVIEDGEFRGFVQSQEGSAPSAPFTATWTAIREGFEQ